jgi:hypothetical protein
MKVDPAFLKKLTRIFNAAAGAELKAKPQTLTLDGKPYVELLPEKGDPVAAKLRKQTGHDLRFILADADKITGARAVYPALAAFVEQDEQGKYRVTPQWNLGWK